MPKFGEFLEIIHSYERLLIQIQVICTVLLVLLSLSWLLKPQEAGSGTYYIVMADIVILGIPFVGISVLRYACSQGDEVNRADEHNP